MIQPFMLSVLIFWSLLSPLMATEVSRFQLKNGLHVFIKPDYRAPIAMVMVWYEVGSADEPGGLTGIAHVLEHMMFKGTPLVPAGEFSKRIAQDGGQDNAFTTQDYTVYFEKISSNALEAALALEADRMQHLHLTEEAFAKEIKVVQEERRLRTDNNPQALTYERFLALAHTAAPYHHPVIGWMTDLQHLSVRQVNAWYQRYYTPNHAHLVIVGAVNPTTIKPTIEKLFNPITKFDATTSLPQMEPPALGMKRLTLHLPAQQPVLLLGYTVPGLKHAPADAYALEVLAAVLDAGENARLTQSIIQTQQLASTANAYYNLYTRYQSQFILFAIPAPNGSSKKLEQALLNEIHQLQTTLVPAAELNRVKTQLIAQKTFEQDSLFGQAMELGTIEIIGLNTQQAAAYTDHIQAVTAEQVKEVANRYLTPHNLTVATLDPIHTKKDAP